MHKMRWLTIITLLVLLFPSQGVQAGCRLPRPDNPTISITRTLPITPFVQINTTATYAVSIARIPGKGMHCVKVMLFVPAGYKVYPGEGYSYASEWTFYHIYGPLSRDFKVRVPNTAGRKFLYAKVSWSRDYACRSVRITNTSPQVEIIVTK
jgi:hypothetical protein